jgi:tetratricopeptide (TPR) repeat protein
VAEAIRALDLYRGAKRDFALELPRLLSSSPDATGVRNALERALESRPSDGPLWFSLAYLYDSEHRLDEARRAYESALAADADDLRALLNLAHLYAGAQMGACAQCDDEYARTPGLPDPERALATLLRAIDVDRGRSEFGAGRIQQTALDLKARFDSSRAIPELVAALERHYASATGAAHSRLSETIQRLRGAVKQR